MLYRGNAPKPERLRTLPSLAKPLRSAEVRMKSRTILLFTLALAMVASASAQQGGRRKGGERMTPEKRLKHLSKELSLSKDQQKQIKPVLEDEQHQLQQLRSNPGDDRQADMAKARDIHRDANEKIKAVLTDDQRSKFENIQKENREKMRRRRGGDQQPSPPPQN